MNISRLRHTLFWLADFASGGKIKKHLAEITTILNDPSSQTSLKFQKANLDLLLNHAVDTTLYYKKYSNFDNLFDFPVITKSEVQEKFDHFRSAKFNDSNLHTVATSGSTGVPFFLFQDSNKRKRNIADVYYYLQAVNHKLGERLYELEIWKEHNKKSNLKTWIQNVIQFDVAKLTHERIEGFIDQISNYPHKKMFLGFASALETICLYLDSNSVKAPHVNTIVANSEYLNDYTRQALKKHFNAGVYSRYSNEEFGIIAHQTADSKDDFKVNWASYFVEVLDLDEDKPANAGELGRIVITDLFNYSMPIIRYDTGDVAKFKVSDSQRPNLEYIQGRKMDMIYDTQGNVLSSFIVYTKFYKYYKDLNQYQFVQTGVKDYTVNLNVKTEFGFEDELIDDIKSDFGQDAIIKINYVDEIPPLASGKRKKVVNLYYES